MNDIIITLKKLKLHSIYFLKMLNFHKIITIMTSITLYLLCSFRWLNIPIMDVENFKTFYYRY